MRRIPPDPETGVPEAEEEAEAAELEPGSDWTLGGPDGTESVPEYESWLVGAARAPALKNPSLQLRPGACIGEQYEIVRLLGQGGMARVYVGRDVRLGRQVAIKLMALPSAPPEVLQQWLLRFEQEAQATARMSHPHIVTLYQFGTWNDHPFIVLELLHGATLAKRISQGPFLVEDALQATAQMLQALVHAHARGIYHRDLKPANLWLTDENQLKILDFGLATLHENSTMSRSQLRAGTPAYMAPEQWEGIEQDGRTDVWAVGLILVEMLLGRWPFAGHSESAQHARVCVQEGPVLPDAVTKEIPTFLQGVITRALTRRKEERPDARTLLEELERLQLSSSIRVATTKASPYRWLEPFRSEDAAVFFGRDREITRLQTFLETHAAVVVLGSSGAGKSSLVHAGLAARLLRKGNWAVLSLRPGSSPLETLGAQIRNLCGEKPEITHPGEYGAILRRYAAAVGKRILVVVDQSEELFTLGAGPSERATFAAALEGLADDPGGPIRLVMTLREDFLSAVSAAFDVHGAVLQGLWPLPPADRQTLLEALTRPALRLGWSFEEGLVDVLLAGLVDRITPLPLLQLAASRLFERRDPVRSLLTLKALASLGGVEGILAAHAEEVLYCFMAFFCL